MLPRARILRRCSRRPGCAIAYGGGRACALIHGVSEICHEVLLSTISQTAMRGPFGVCRHTDCPNGETWPFINHFLTPLTYRRIVKVLRVGVMVMSISSKLRIASATLAGLYFLFAPFSSGGAWGQYLIPSRIVRDSRGFPNQQQSDSPWQPRGLRWARLLRCGRTTRPARFAGLRRGRRMRRRRGGY